MNFGWSFFVTNIMLGVGLAMDAFSVSLANGLNEPCMRKIKVFAIAGTFAFFQALMPMLGWICVHTIAQHFKTFEMFIPWIALILLGFIGGKMLIEGIKNETDDPCLSKRLGLTALIMQGIATSIDALSVGFAIASYNLVSALFAALIIALVTFCICLPGVLIGRSAGTKLAGKAGILGGIILIGIGIEIFISGIF
ncbi:MAG: manganese efflux pump [Ruminococcaceae bacterium]|nr:manganese efflux pump [Oscillospiraceae bacterium]